MPPAVAAERSQGRPLAAASLMLLLLVPALRGAGEQAVAPPRSGFVIAPVVYYTPETRLAWGLVGIHHFRLGRALPSSRPSHYRFNFVRTQNKQSIAQVDYELYLADGKFLVDGVAKYSYFPDRFYGIGNRSLEEDREDFTSSNWRLQLNLQRRWGRNAFIGLRLETYDVSMRAIESDGWLAGASIPGAAGGTVSGLGVFAKWDSRDNTFSPARGTYFSLFFNRFFRALGGDFAFGQVSLDTRGYFDLGADQVVAVQGILRAVQGAAPFLMLPKFGGLNLLRGYYDGRYCDRGLLALQAEYRRPLWGRFGACAFAGMAQVQPRFSLLELSGFHLAGGAGLRYKFNRRENLNVRLDVGFAGPTPAFYLTFAEAF
jgi:hypothetical protein